MIPFNKPPYTGNEDRHVLNAIRSPQLSGGGDYCQKCQKWFEEVFFCQKALLTPSCTHALEMAAILVNIRPGDEVIIPSYTFVSTANAFVLRGAKIVFVDIRPDTMNIDETLIERAITDKTKAIVPVHYAGVGCEMDTIMEVANAHNLFVIEDAAQGIMSTYKEKYLGTIGHLGTYSFHETKNCTSGGEGGLLSINDKNFLERSEIVCEKGTNRNQFFRGLLDKYNWVDIGSSYLLSELQAAYLWGQLENIENINSIRLEKWNIYYENLSILEKMGLVSLPTIPTECRHNAHMFYLKTKNLEERTELIGYLKRKGIMAVFHYVPLHSAPAGLKFGRFHGQDVFTTAESERLVRLPMWHGLHNSKIQKIAQVVLEFYV